MTLEQVKNIIGLFAPPMPVGTFVTHYNDGELKLFYLKANEKDFTALRKFKKVKGDGTAPLYVTDGRASIPSDYFGEPGGYYMNGTTPVDINFVGDKEFDRLITHKIEFPIADYPIANIQPDYIRVRPTSVKFIVFSYLAPPVPVTYATTNTRGFLEFDATNSSEVKWGEDDIVILIQNILQSIGITVNQQEIKSKIK